MISPKAKAEELVDKFRKHVNDGRYNGFYSGEITFENQKQCALIAVDEILNEYWSHDTKREKFWQEVRNEINKI